MRHHATAAHVAAFRRFNRFYTARADLLNDNHLGSGFALGEGRLLFEIAHRTGATASELCRDLRLDAGYVSRMLRSLRRRGLVKGTVSPDDRRQSRLALTRSGRQAFVPLNAAASARVRAILTTVPSATQSAIVGSLATVERALAAPGALPARLPPARLRRPRPGELGWVVQRHGELYSAEYGYDERMEGLIAKVVGDFVANFDPARERCWIADRDGRPVGSVFLTHLAGRTAKLRLLLVEPSERGSGLGRRLIHACTTFARATGYRRIELWTQSELVAARKLYVREGYRLVSRKRHAMFGRPAVAETWALRLTTKTS